MSLTFLFLLNRLFADMNLERINDLIKINSGIFHLYSSCTDNDSLPSFLKICSGINISNRLALSKRNMIIIVELLRYNYIDDSLLDNAEDYLNKTLLYIEHIKGDREMIYYRNFFNYFRKNFYDQLSSGEFDSRTLNSLGFKKIFILSSFLDWHSNSTANTFLSLCYYIYLYNTNMVANNVHMNLKELLMNFFRREIDGYTSKDCKNMISQFVAEFILVMNTPMNAIKEIEVHLQFRYLSIAYERRKDFTQIEGVEELEVRFKKSSEEKISQLRNNIESMISSLMIEIGNRTIQPLDIPVVIKQELELEDESVCLENELENQLFSCVGDTYHSSTLPLSNTNSQESQPSMNYPHQLNDLQSTSIGNSPLNMNEDTHPDFFSLVDQLDNQNTGTPHTQDNDDTFLDELLLELS